MDSPLNNIQFQGNDLLRPCPIKKESLKLNEIEPESDLNSVKIIIYQFNIVFTQPGLESNTLIDNIKEKNSNPDK